jgi:hypothetical protein
MRGVPWHKLDLTLKPTSPEAFCALLGFVMSSAGELRELTLTNGWPFPLAGMAEFNSRVAALLRCTREAYCRKRNHLPALSRHEALELQSAYLPVLITCKKTRFRPCRI